MNTFIEDITKQEEGSRQLSSSSAKTYRTNLGKLSRIVNGTDTYPDNHDWLKDYDKVIKILDEQNYAPRTYGNYVSLICVVLSPTAPITYRDGFTEVGKKYSTLQTKLKVSEKALIAEQKLSNTDKAKWTTMKQLVKIRQGYAKELKIAKFNLGKTGRSETLELKRKELKLLQMYVVASLYTMDFSNRNVYGKCKIITGVEYKNMMTPGFCVPSTLQKNYLVVDKDGKKQTKFFSLGDTKNSWTKVTFGGKGNSIIKKWKGVIKVPINDDLNKVINLWLKYKPVRKTDWFLVSSRNSDKPLGTNGLSKLVAKTFKATGKKIGSNIIRKIMNTEKFAAVQKASAEAAMKSGHSVAVQQTQYVKHIEDIEDSDSDEMYGTIGFPANSLNECPFCGESGCSCGSEY
jgi:hypothetical protein